MTSTGIAISFGIIFVWCPAAALADEASKNAKIEEILQLAHVDRTTTQMLDQVKTMLTAQLGKMDVPVEAHEALGELQQKMMALIADRLSWEKTKGAFIKVYSETFTEGEIDGILAFYKSPPGQAMLEKMPQLTQKSIAAGQQLMSDAAPEIERMVEELKQKYAKK